MSKKLRSLRWRTLTHRGFIIEPAPGESVERSTLGKYAGGFSEFTKHPAILVILGFTLTGVIGRWLADVQDDKTRQREAAVKSMDDLRASIDDLSLTFQAYFNRTSKLIDLMEHAAPKDEIERARDNYQDAQYKWSERLAVDSTNIKQRYPSVANDPTAPIIMNALSFGSTFIDDCISYGTLVPVHDDPLHRSFNLVCHDIKSKVPPTASSRLVNVAVCVNIFATVLRPDPRYDFDQSVNLNLLELMGASSQKTCNLSYMVGVTDYMGKRQ
jgi:hypothetical protein